MFIVQKTPRKLNVKGFTLVEIMAVTAIISMVTAMSVPNLMRMRVNSNETAVQQNLGSLQKVLEDYRFANGTYPSTNTEINSFVNTYYGRHSVISNPSGTSWNFQGYQYAYRLNGPEQWEWVALPNATGVTGNRCFVFDPSGLREVTSSYAHTVVEGQERPGRTCSTCNPFGR